MKFIYTNNMNKFPEKNEIIIPKYILSEKPSSINMIENVHSINTPKTKNTFVHVFWSKPALIDKERQLPKQYEMTLAFSALSLACLKAHNQKVILITDTKGKELLNCLPYDEIHTILDDYDIPDKFWAAGKIAALKYLPNDVILIDNDLFLYDGQLIDKINENDVICSHFEEEHGHSKLLKASQSILPWLHKASTPYQTSNTGILKINNEFLKKLFIEIYDETIKLLTDNNQNIIAELKNIKGALDAPDLIAEQFNFHCLCKPAYVATIDVTNDYKCNCGFCHFYGAGKYLRTPLVLKALEKNFPNYYTMVLNKWNELDFHLIVE